MRKLLILFILMPVPSAALAGTPAAIFGGEMTYTVEEGDSLVLIGARLGLDWFHIARINAINPKKPIRPGDKLWVNNRKITPEADVPPEGGCILINIPDRMLYYYKDGALKRAFPVGLGLLKKAGGIWRTPLGKFSISVRDRNPIWYVPKSIQREMEAEGKEVKAVVPPGPENPLGRFALRTTMGLVRIHETIAPSSVYGFQSHACIRVLPRDMEGFFGEAAEGTPGELIYRPVKVAVTPGGRVYLEVYRDFYGRVKDMNALARELIEKSGASDKADWEKVETVIREKAGVAEDVTK